MSKMRGRGYDVAPSARAAPYVTCEDVAKKDALEELTLLPFPKGPQTGESYNPLP